MIGYKVVVCHKQDEQIRYYSAIMTTNKVEYKIGEWVEHEPNAGPLAVFNTIEDAIHFVHQSVIDCWVKIFKCKYKPSKERKLWYYIEEEKLSLSITPDGTCFAEKVKLLKEKKDFN